MVHPGYGDDLPDADGYRSTRRKELEILLELGPELHSTFEIVSMEKLLDSFEDRSE